MNANEMFALFTEEKNLPQTEFEAFSFGTDADLLSSLVLQGRKTACSSAYEIYEHEKAPLPRAGQYSVVLDSSNEAVCIVRTSLVYICDFGRVAPLHAAKEGEGDGSLTYWRKAHEAFFSQELAAIGRKLTRSTPVVCEEFELVYPIQKEDKKV